MLKGLLRDGIMRKQLVLKAVKQQTMTKAFVADYLNLVSLT